MASHGSRPATPSPLDASPIDGGEYLIKNNGRPQSMWALATSWIPHWGTRWQSVWGFAVRWPDVVYYSCPHHEIVRLASVKFHLFTCNSPIQFIQFYELYQHFSSSF